MKNKKVLAAFVIGALVSPALAFASLSSPTYQTLTALIQGSNTTYNLTVLSNLWGWGIPLQTPIITSSGTSTGGTLASSTPFAYEVMALDGTGTTTVSNEGTATTQFGVATNAIVINWPAVTGATGYEVAFATSTAGGENQCFIATSTTAFYMSTSTGSFACTPPTGSTAYMDKINPAGLSFFNGGGISVGGNSTITGNLNVTGTITNGEATTTAAIGGGSLTGGTCTTATTTLTVGTVSSSSVIVTTPQKYPGDDVNFYSFALNATQIVTKVCEPVTATPISTGYNLRVIQ